jgi:ribonuclease HI
MSSALPPAPDHVERHPPRYPWASRGFADIRVLAKGEGSATYAATGEGALWIIKDEGTVADFLPQEEHGGLIQLECYEDLQAWSRAVSFIIEGARARFEDPDLPHFSTYEEERQRWQESFDERQQRKGGTVDIEKGFYQLHIDGGRKHPKDGEEARAAISFILCDPKGRELPEGRHSRALEPPVSDSTSAEYEAGLAGLAEARQRGITYIALFTDSRNLVNQLSGRFEARGHLADYRDKLETVLREFSDWQVSWVPREWNKAHGDVAGSL